MQILRKASDRGHFDFEWLDTHHTFSFGDYQDPKYMSFGHLRVINEDRIAPGVGFDPHGHRDMEIITYVLSGALAHKDSMGNATVIRPGEIQRMTAGTGIEHSEINHLKDETTHFYQIWILPDRKGHKPSYGQKDFSAELSSGELTLLCSHKGRDGSISLEQDAEIWAARLTDGREYRPRFARERRVWLQVARGTVQVGDLALVAGDGLGVTEETELVMSGVGAEILIFST